jgi:hypothetical protein
MDIPTVEQKRLVIVGATGMVGGYALRYALGLPAVERETSISRGKIGNRVNPCDFRSKNG